MALQQILYTIGSQGLNVISSFLFVPLLLNYYDSERYGVWLTLISIVGWFNILDIGLSNGLRNKLTDAIAKDEKELGRKYISTTYALLAIIISIVFIIFNLIFPFLDWQKVLNTTKISSHELYWLAVVVFGAFCLRFLLQPISTIYIAHQKSSFNNFVQTAGNVLALLLVFLVTKITENANLVVLGTIVTVIPVIIYLLASVLSFKSRFKEISPSGDYVDFKIKKDLLSLGLKFFVVQITAMAIFSTTNFLILQLFGSEEVVRYNIAFKLFSVVIMIYGILLSPIWSAVTDAYSRNDFIWLKVTLRRFNMISLGFVCGILLILYFSDFLYSVWIGSTVNIPFHLSAGIALYAIIWVITAPFSTFINGFGKLKLTMSFSILGIVTFFAITFILSGSLNSSLAIALALSFTSLIGLTVQGTQVIRIINKKAFGIFLR
ncbi:MAG: hypothetical protein HRU80_15460 [Ignavibacteriales bacterium]|nr:MAG: hypothetical protein HRU80_15460 [Ignavibacteriales bacterium]